MKKSILLSIITILLFGQIKGQSDPQAKSILTEMQKKYDALSSMEVDFEMSIEIPEEEPEIQTGHFKKQGDLFMMDSEIQSVYSDGKDVWVHLKDNNEVQINNIEEGEESMSSLSPSGLLATYASDDYFFAITNKNKTETTIEFKPLDEDDEISKVRMIIDHKTDEIKKVKIFNKDGSRYSIKIINIVPNKMLDSNVFVFNKEKYPNVYIEDLRID